MLSDVISILRVSGPMSIKDLRDILLVKGYTVTFEEVKTEVRLLVASGIINRAPGFFDFPNYKIQVNETTKDN